MKMTMADGSVFEGSLSEWHAMVAQAFEVSETDEVLSADNVKEGDYFVITGNKHEHNFAVGEVVKAKSHSDSTTFKAEYTDGSDWWFVRYTSVRRATAEEIAEATKSKEVKFEVGDTVAIDGFNSMGKVTHDVDKDDDYKVKFFSDGDWAYAGTSELRHATDEEKSSLQTLIGREKDEYKIGDIVELVGSRLGGYYGRNGYLFEIDEIYDSSVHLKDNENKTSTSNTYYEPSVLKLVVPVEYRHDFVGGE